MWVKYSARAVYQRDLSFRLVASTRTFVGAKGMFNFRLVVCSGRMYGITARVVGVYASFRIPDIESDRPLNSLASQL